MDSHPARRLGASLRFWILAAMALRAPSAHAFLPDDITSVTQPYADALVKIVGFALEHRPFEGATPLGTTVGLDMGGEFTLVKIPQSLLDDLAGASSGMSSLQMIPVPKLHLHKGLGPAFGVGLSGTVWFGMFVLGGDMKITLNQPEEGPVWALRLGYTYSKVQVMTTQTLSPQLVVSRRLDFAEPYLGIGVPYAWGKMAIEQDLGPLGTVSFAVHSRAYSFNAFTGVQFRAGTSGLALTLEGSYHQLGMHTLGAKAGLAF